MNIQLDTHKVCNYFGKKEECPFESIGCMFLHLDTPQDQDAQSEDAIEMDDADSFIPVETSAILVEIRWKIKIIYEEYFTGGIESVQNQSCV